MFSLIYLWLIAAVILAGADLLLGTVYLLIIGLAALATFVIALLGLGLLFQLLAFAVFAIAGCVFLSFRKRKANPDNTNAEKLQHINDGHTVEVSHWNENGKARVFYRGTVWDAKPEKNSEKVPGLWQIVGMSGNTLIIKLKEEK